MTERGTEPTSGGPADPGSESFTRPDGTWVVWRQDDHGIRAEVARHPDREPAEPQRAELGARGHKQIYWVEHRD